MFFFFLKNQYGVLQVSILCCAPVVVLVGVMIGRDSWLRCPRHTMICDPFARPLKVLHTHARPRYYETCGHNIINVMRVCAYYNSLLVLPGPLFSFVHTVYTRYACVPYKLNARGENTVYEWSTYV